LPIIASYFLSLSPFHFRRVGITRYFSLINLETSSSFFEISNVAIGFLL